MPVVYRSNPWAIAGLPYYPLWPFSEIDLWFRRNLVYEVGVKEEGFPSGVSYHSRPYARLCSRDVFLCAGLLMSPAIYDSGPRAWAFFLEHAESLRGSHGDLRVVFDCVHWEERVRTIFCERFGVGLAGWLLWNSYDALHIADAGPFLSRTISDPASPYHRRGLRSLGLSGKNGGLKPDFFCITNSGECVIAESKGGFGPPGNLTVAKKKGKEQVDNVNPVGVTLRKDAGRLVFASNLRHEGENPRQGKGSCITVVDPEGDENAIKIKVSADEITLHSYCKVLSFCGLHYMARQLLRGVPVAEASFLQERAIDIGGHKVLPLLMEGSQVLGLDAQVAGILFENGGELFQSTAEALQVGDISGVVSSDGFLRLPNGVVFGEID